MKKKLLICILCFLTVSPVFAQCKCNQTCPKTNCSKSVDDDLKFYKNYAEQVKKERCAVSNALQLTEEQTKCRIQIVKENSQLFEEKFRKLYQENIKLKALKFENASAEAIKLQEKNVNCIKKEINDIVEKENKDFKKILDHDQRSKLNMIQKLQRKSAKSCKNPKDYYKSNPKMRRFAPTKSQTCECDNN